MNNQENQENVIEWFETQTLESKIEYLNSQYCIENKLFDYFVDSNYTDLIKSIIKSAIFISKDNLDKLRSDEVLFEYCIETRYNMLKNASIHFVYNIYNVCSNLSFIKEYDKREFLDNNRVYLGGEDDILFKYLANPNRVGVRLLDISLNNACKNGLKKVIKAHIDNGADINMESEDDNCLSIACRYGSFESVNFLIENGADINFSDGMCINYSISDDRDKITELLLSDYSKLTSNTINHIMNYLTEDQKYFKHVEALIDRVDDFDLANYALNIACMTSDDTKLPMIKLLIEVGAEICETDGLVESIENGASIKVIKYLLENGADVSKSDYRALKSARDRPEVIDILMEYGYEDIELI